MKVISERVLKEMGEYGLEIRSIANATGGMQKITRHITVAMENHSFTSIYIHNH